MCVGLRLSNCWQQLTMAPWSVANHQKNPKLPSPPVYHTSPLLKNGRQVGDGSFNRRQVGDGSFNCRQVGDGGLETGDGWRRLATVENLLGP